MRWQRAKKSENVEAPTRSAHKGRNAALGGGGLIVVIVAVLFGVDPDALTKLLGSATGGARATIAAPRSAAEAELTEFVAHVLGDTEVTWHQLFRDMGRTYVEPKLHPFHDSVATACGYQQAAVGPFYCPADQKVYIDLSFYEDLHNRFGASGDFAQAYVIAHEVGHHVQKLLGTSDRVNALRARASQEEANDLSVRLELQADFYAGVWAHYARVDRDLLDAGDLEEALNAAAAIGDDRLQRQARGYVSPESFTHGTSEQRMRWFRRGYETGDPAQGDTFSARKP